MCDNIEYGEYMQGTQKYENYNSNDIICGIQAKPFYVQQTPIGSHDSDSERPGSFPEPAC